MNSSILHFNEIGLKIIEKINKRFLKDEIKDIGNLMVKIDKCKLCYTIN